MPIPRRKLATIKYADGNATLLAFLQESTKILVNSTRAASKLEEIRCTEVASVISNSSGPIVLASDFSIFRDSLKAYLEQETDIKTIGCGNSEQEVIPVLQSSEPKLVLLDLKLEWKALCALLSCAWFLDARRFPLRPFSPAGRSETERKA